MAQVYLVRLKTKGVGGGGRGGGGGGGTHIPLVQYACKQTSNTPTTKKCYIGRLGKGKTERRIKYIMRKTDRQQLVSH